MSENNIMITKTYPIIEKLLKNGLDLSSSLLDLLNKESDNLESNANSTALSSLVARKKEIISQLDQFSRQLSQVLATEKLPHTPAGVLDYFNKAKVANFNTVDSSNLWQKIVSMTKQCRFINEKNGASINILAQHTQRSLNILKGASQQTTTYGPDGSTYNEGNNHPLISV